MTTYRNPSHGKRTHALDIACLVPLIAVAAGIVALLFFLPPL